MSNSIKSNNFSEVSAEDQIVSDLIDGHCDSDKVDCILESESARERWYRYNLASSVIKKEHSAFSSIEFTRSISAKIAEEPAIIAAPSQAKTQKSTGSNVVSFWKRTGGGLAVAASVAYATVFSVQMLDSGTEIEDGGFSALAVTDEADVVISSQVLVSSAEAEQQAKLDEIQSIINKIGSNDLRAYEQQVGGEWIYRKVIKTDPLPESDNSEDNNFLKPILIEENN